MKAIYDRRDRLHLSGEALQLVKVYYQQFIHSGAQLSDADKAKLRAINTREATLSTKFEHQLLAGTKAAALVVDNVKQLDGLSASEIAAAANDAKNRKLAGKWVLPLQNTTQQPALQSLADRDTREKLFNQRWTATEKGDANDTRATIAEIAQLRAQKAKLLGYPSYAAYTLYDQMAEDAGRGGDIPQASGARDGGTGTARSGRCAGGDRQVRREIPAEALGLGSLRATDPQGALRSG